VASDGVESPLLSFGLISDIQYADIPDGASYSGTPRFYRHAVESVSRAAESWKQADVAFAVHLGDIVDGFCPRNQSITAVTTVADALSIFKGMTYHAVGNHCLYNLERDTLAKLLGTPQQPRERKTGPGDPQQPRERKKDRYDQGCLYYHFDQEEASMRFIVLDCYDISLTWPQASGRHQQAKRILSEGRGEARLGNVNSPAELEGLSRRFVGFNGAVGTVQLEWLDTRLAEAKERGLRVILISHNPLHPSASPSVCLLWNYEQVLATIHKYSDTVVLCLAGHAHSGGFCEDERGIYHRVMEATVECAPGVDAYATVQVFDNRLHFQGTGKVESKTLYFKDKTAGVAEEPASVSATGVPRT